MTSKELERFPKELESYFTDLEIHIMEDIVRRIRINGEITRAADWQIIRLKELGSSEAYIRDIIATLLNQSKADVNKLFEEAAKQEYVRDKTLYEQIGKSFIPYSKNLELQQFVFSIADQTNKQFANITGSLGFAKDTATGLKSESLSAFYRRTLDNAMMEIATGTFDYNTVLKRTIKAMTNSGLRYIDYDTGWKNRVQVACTRAVSTGLGQITGKVTEVNSNALGTDYVEVSWHATARTGVGVGNHQAWQGYVYHWNRHGIESGNGYKDFVESTGYGVDPMGLHGYNCRHTFYPFILGVSKRTYTDEQLEEMRKAENTPKVFRGKEYTSYEATQRMRKLETRMRVQRQEIKLLEHGGALEDDIINAKVRYRTTMNEYSKFAKTMELPQQRQRIYNDSYGKIGGGKGVAKAYQNGIIESEIKSLGFKGKLNINPKVIDIEKLSFDDKHINQERTHKITFEEAKQFIQEAKISETVWNGKFERYYSEKGTTYVNMESNTIRTAFSSGEYTDNIIKMMEVLNKHGR